MRKPSWHNMEREVKKSGQSVHDIAQHHGLLKEININSKLDVNQKVNKYWEKSDIK